MKFKTSSALGFLLILVIAVIAMLTLPFLGIWCINTLFSVTIAYTWKNWVAFFLLLFVTKASLTSGK